MGDKYISSIRFDEVLNLKLIEDYSAFGELTQYQKTVVDRLRAEGLADSEIKRMLKEF